MTYTFRAPVKEDIDGVYAVFVADQLNAPGFVLNSQEEIEQDWWGLPDFDLSRDALVAVSEQGQIAAYMSIMPRAPYIRMFCPMSIHPDHRVPGVEEPLFAWVEQRGRELMAAAPADTRVVLIDTALATDPYYTQLYARMNYQVIRHILEMQIKLTETPPAPVFPAGVTIRTFNPEQDMRALFHAYDESFKDHFGHVPMPEAEAYERFVHRTRVSSFDPALWYIVEEGSEIIAFALCQASMPEDETAAWVDTLGVQRPWRRNGVALALLHHVFGEMYQRGKSAVGLGVDAQSLTGATRLYEKAGMHPTLRFEMVEKALREGMDMTTVAVSVE